MDLPARASLETAAPRIARLAAHPLALSVFQALDSAGVRWCLLRDGIDKGDIDLLIDPDDLPVLSVTMRGHGLKRLSSYGRGTHTFFLGFDEAVAGWVKFDVVTALDFGRYLDVRTPAAREFLARRAYERGLWRPHPDDEFWALLLHCMVDRGDFPERHTDRLLSLAPAAGVDGPLARLLPPEFPPATLHSWTLAGSWDTLAAAGPALHRAFRRRAPLSASRARLRNRLLRAVERPLQVPDRLGPSVALLGPDGSGKSTLAAGIAETFYFPVRGIYMGMWPVGEKPSGPLSAVWIIARRPLLLWLRYLNALRHRLLGRMVVFDRYAYDALLPPRPPLVWLKRPYLWLLSRSCPSPNLVVVLDAPGRLMYARSGEHDVAYLEAARQYYARLSARLPFATSVASDRPPEQVRTEVLGHIWRHYRDRGRR